MMVGGILLLAHGFSMLVVTIGGAIGYAKRGMWKDAIGVMLTFSVSAVAEIALGCLLITRFL